MDESGSRARIVSRKAVRILRRRHSPGLPIPRRAALTPRTSEQPSRAMTTNKASSAAIAVNDLIFSTCDAHLERFARCGGPAPLWPRAEPPTRRTDVQNRSRRVPDVPYRPMWLAQSFARWGNGLRWCPRRCARWTPRGHVIDWSRTGARAHDAPPHTASTARCATQYEEQGPIYECEATPPT